MSTNFEGSITGDQSREISRKRSNDLKPTSKLDSQRHHKRSRVSRACDQCRASREKCDGSQPTCHSCVAQRRTCTYNEQPKKRGIQPNYIRTLELTLGWFAQSYPECVSELAHCLPVQDHPTTKLLLGKDSDAAESLHTIWRNSIICRQVDQLLSGAPVESPNAALPNASHNGTQRHPQAYLPLTPSETSLNRQSFSTSIPSCPISREDKIKLPGNAWKLLEYYFAFTHAWLPLTEKTTILKLMYSYPETGLPSTICATPAYTELWAIMALAETQMASSTATSDESSTMEIARKLIPYDTRLISRSHAKTFLIFTLVEMTRKAWTSAWLSVGIATQLVLLPFSPELSSLLSSDLLSPPRSSNKSVASFSDGAVDAADNNDKASYLAAVVLENAVSVECQIQRHFGNSKINSADLLQEDGPEEWAPWQDPLVVSSSARAPTRAHSSLNVLARGTPAMSRLAASENTSAAIVLALVMNAADAHGHPREQPFALISRQLDSDTLSHVYSNVITDDLSPLQSHARYMSIPQEPNSCNASNESPALTQQLPVTDDLWQVGTTSSTVNPDTMILSNSMDIVDSGANIFEELALLERKDESQHPDFMRNLGFGPDIDLAEFFGADYQPSDPMLAYVQPAFGLTPMLDGQDQLNTG